jgi:hypothetical protein
VNFSRPIQSSLEANLLEMGSNSGTVLDPLGFRTDVAAIDGAVLGVREN